MSPARSWSVRVTIAAVGVLLAGSGLLNLWILMHAPGRFQPPGWLRILFPLGAEIGPSPVQFLIGFATVLAGFHLWARKKRALRMAVCLATASSIFLWTGGHVQRAVASLAIAMAMLLGNTGLDRLTPHAVWFLESLLWVSAAAFTYCGVVLFKPVTYHFFGNSSERERARPIAERYGRSGQDFLKQWPDKSLFFSHGDRSFIAYRVANDFALTLGDPVGPDDDLPTAIEQFVGMCRGRGWRVGFHQVQGDRLHLYENLGFRGLKIGAEAVVDMNRFSLDGSAMKETRNTVARVERAGYRVRVFEAPLENELLDQLQRVSDQWLGLPGHRERRFTLSTFSRGYVRRTRVYAALDADGKVVAFLNIVPSHDPDLATVDLMRGGRDNTNGLMDYLFAMAFLDSKARGCRRFSLGLAPLDEFGEDEEPSGEDKVVQWGVRRFKATYTGDWQPRYEVYGSRWDLPRLALALRSVTEIRDRRAA